MYFISPFEISNLLDKIKVIGDNKGEVSGIQVSDEFFILYNPILNKFDFARIIDSSNEDNSKTIFFDDFELADVNYVYSIDKIGYEYKRLFYSNYFNFKNDKVNKVLSFMFLNEIILYIFAILFLLLAILIVKVLNLTGSVAAFIIIFAFICVLFLFNVISSKKS